ncbi:AAA family ATPase [Roseomonas marmotae]|uniref:AAA family ATPase n=1 Tax=Roseomonas marmotae TaxID=2768161 RepID=A0ABS3K7C8_9PROT|nr:AAA family ATPase [Roseomonas marmotae]MBO1073359.1 AAA family ATPase [Roseomonas marmotae]
MDASPEDLLKGVGARTRYSNAPPPPRRAISLAECGVRPDAEYLVKGLIRPMDLILVVGEPGAGKSILVPLLAHRIATGERFFGKRVRKGPVLYVAAEAGQDMRERFHALRERHGAADDLHLWPYPMDLLTEGSGDADMLREEARRLRAKLIIVDTLPAAFPGLEENEAVPMGRVRDTLRRLGRDTGAAVLAVHHPAKGGETSRGHGNLRGDAEVEFFVKGTGDAERTVTMNKNRNGTSAGTFSFSVSTVDLGEDSDGDRIIRPVAAESDDGGPRAAKLRRSKPTPEQAIMLRELENLVHDGAGEMGAPRSNMPQVRVIPRHLLRARLVASGWFTPDQLPEVLPESLPDQTKLSRAGYRAENKALSALQNKGYAGFSQTGVWLV